MDIQTVLREVVVRGTAVGMDQVEAAYYRVGASADNSGAAIGRTTAQSVNAEAELKKLAVQLQSTFAEQQRFNEMLVRQSDAFAQAAAANDNAESTFGKTGVRIAELANHMRQAAEAAYIFSPAFRGVVDGLRGPALEGASVALEAVASAMVRGVNLAGTGLITLAGAVERVAPGFLGLTSYVRSAGVALEAFAPTVGGIGASVLGLAGTVLSRFLPIVGQLLLLYDAIKLIGEAWELGATKLKDYTDLAAKAASLNVSTDFLQRLTKSAEAAKLPIDSLTASLTKMQDALAPKLGGSDAIAEIDKLVSYGNFRGNTGIAAIKQATTAEQQFAAVLDFYRQATAASEKLAALDVVKTIFGPQVAANLAKDDEYLAKIKRSMDEVAQKDLVKQEDIDRAVALQIQWDAAVKILEQRWHPIQDLLTELGVKMQTVWVNIVSAIAQAVDAVYRLAAAIYDRIPQKFWDFLSKGAGAGISLAAGAVPGIGPVLSAGINYYNGQDSAGAPVDPLAAARARLASGLSNPSNVTAARDQTTALSEQLRPDRSHTKPLEEETAAYDRATEAVLKYIEVTKAAATTVGLSVDQQEKAKVVAQLTAAAMKDGTPITAELAAEMAKLGDQAAAAALDLEKTKVAASIKFDRDTAFLSPQDVQIAQQLKGIYGNDIPAALASSEASAIRVNNAIKESRDAGVDFAKTFVGGLLQGKSAMDALTDAASQLASKLGDKAITDILSGNFIQGGIEGVVAIGASIFAGDQKAKKELQEAQQQWAAMADQVTKFNQAAAGVNLGPLTNELQSLSSNFETLVLAAIKAKDNTGATALAQTFQQGISRVVGEFEQSNTLSNLQTSIKAVNDEAQGLKETLTQITSANHWGVPDFSGIDAAVQEKIKKLIEDATDTLTSTLASRLNTAQGKTYLNDAANLLAQHKADLASAAELGNNPAVLAQISAVFQAEAQKIVQDAGLVGDSFTDFTRQFPELAGVVKQATVDITDSIKTISQYLESLKVGSNSILSPQDQLAAAQANFSQQLGLAQGGDSTALGSITQYAQTLLDQAKSFYASSDGYAAIYTAVTAALGALTGVSSFAGTSTATTTVAPAVSSGIATGSTTTLAGASNDNGQYFAQQTQALVQAIGAAATAEVQALRDGIDILTIRLDRIAVATEASARKPLRPGQKAAA